MSDELTHAQSRTSLLGANPSDEKIYQYSNELQVKDNTPIAFIALSEDDWAVHVDNSMLYYKACINHNIPAELHIYPSGGHGWGFNDFDYHDIFLESLSKWLTTYNLNDCIAHIGDFAFASCIKFRSLALTPSIITIGDNAFFACTQVSRLTLGRQLQEMGENAFSMCERLRQITVNAMIPPAIHKSTFTDNTYSNAMLAVPDESIEDYRTALYWKDFTAIEPSAIGHIHSDNTIQVIASRQHIDITGVSSNADVLVYSTDGTLILQTTANDLTQHTFNSGIYLVKVADSTHKVAL